MGKSKIICIVMSILLAMCQLTPVRAGSLRGPGQPSIQDVQKSLASQLAANVSSKRMAELENSLRVTFAALPKQNGELLGHQAVRYMLHRQMLQRHGWFLVGLEPNDVAPPPYLNGEWVTSFLQGLLEQRLGGRGIDLHELTALAAALEDIVHKETAQRLETTYQLLQFPITAELDAAEADQVIMTFAMLYLEGNFSHNAMDLPVLQTYYSQDYADWREVGNWFREMEMRYLKSSSGSVTKYRMPALLKVVDEIGKHFGEFNDRECKNLKDMFYQMEDKRMVGRVSLSEFYKKGLHSHWNFNEKADYLRQLGALDESDPTMPRVIGPNYLGARTNCLESSSLYAVCCRNECEDLMLHLEGVIAAPKAEPERIAQLVAALPSDSVAAPRKLPTALLGRLQDVAVQHGGMVPLHGRLFAQWMHHAYPRECPFPHQTGTVSPLTPNEWMREAGQENAKASAEEMQTQVASDTCSGTGPCSEARDLPWSSTEELFVSQGTPVHDHKEEQEGGWTAFNVAMLLLAAALFVTGQWPHARELPAALALLEEAAGASKRRADLQKCATVAGLAAAAAGFGILDPSAFGLAACLGIVAFTAPRLLAQVKTKNDKSWA
mmetsp:Transcript_114003/g.226841  ORF Transcript_114003/g.226841 Transcript_114003/m.226841 type:complete len:608 (+) Transcript_114003:107-1930(+)